MLISISDIKIKHRVRTDLGDIDSLKESLRTYGLLCPIVLNSKYELIAGGRRLEAAKALGWESIESRIIDDIDEIKNLEMEMEENNQRKEFTQDELMAGFERLERLRNPTFWDKIKKFFHSLWSMILKLFRK